MPVRNNLNCSNWDWVTQIQWLTDNDFRFVIRSDGRPNVLIRHVEEKLSDPLELDLANPELQLELELELRIAGDDVELRVWAVGARRPDEPQVALKNDRTYRAGMSSVGFRHSPNDGPVRIFSFCVSEVN